MCGSRKIHLIFLVCTPCPHPSRNSNFASYFSLRIFAFVTPPPPPLPLGISLIICWGSMDYYFLELHNRSIYDKSCINLYILIVACELILSSSFEQWFGQNIAYWFFPAMYWSCILFTWHPQTMCPDLLQEKKPIRKSKSFSWRNWLSFFLSVR